MKKKQTKTPNGQLSPLVKKWEKIWSNLNECNIYFQSYIDNVLLVNQRIKMEPLIKSFNTLKTLMEGYYDLLDETQASSGKVMAVEITLPFDSDKFRNEWEVWKDYLKEQHQIELSSRSEKKQLDVLVRITNNQEENVYPILEYAEANLYKMFFKLDEKQPKTNKKSKTIRRDEDF